MMKNNRNRFHNYFFILLTISLMSVSLNLFSQNNYSAFWNSELRLNPAFTGVIPTSWRANELFRNVKLNDGTILKRNTIYADFRKEFSKAVGDYGVQAVSPTGNIFGLGIIDDRIRSDSSIAEYSADYLSLSFRKKIKKSAISIGVQPGFLRNELDKKFDLNVGLLWGKDYITCWQEDQFYKYQFGVSAYNVLSDWKDSVLFSGREVQAHFGVLFDKLKKIDFVANAYYKYDSENHFSIGTYALFFPDKHYTFFDRARLGIHYRSSNHLSFSGGLRLYGVSKRTFAADAIISYDLPLSFLNVKTSYKQAFELGVVVYIFEKCWSLSRCGN